MDFSCSLYRFCRKCLECLDCVVQWKKEVKASTTDLQWPYPTCGLRYNILQDFFIIQFMTTQVYKNLSVIDDIILHRPIGRELYMNRIDAIL